MKIKAGQIYIDKRSKDINLIILLVTSHYIHFSYNYKSLDNFKLLREPHENTSRFLKNYRLVSDIFRKD